MTPESEKLPEPSVKLAWSQPPYGISRFSLLLLVAFVILINLPYITRLYMPSHDSKMVLGIFDYIYSNWFFADELPHWMVYGLHGLDSSAFQLVFVSAASYLTMFFGKILGVEDSLTLFSITLCVEQLIFLTGLYLLSNRLFRERLTVFCICLTAVGMISWQAQLFFNLRMFCMLPLAFYLILRVRHDGAGYCGWLAGIVAIVGPEGFTYAYTVWGLILTIFSLGVFWGNFRCVKAMLQLQTTNLLSALFFVALALSFLGTIWHSLDNFTFESPGRGSTGKVALASFLTYGGNRLNDTLSALLFPSSFIGPAFERSGMADYVGLICFLCLPMTFLHRHDMSLVFPFLVTLVVILALSLGGLLSSILYFFPGMELYRHLGLLTGVMKILILILAGFGCDTLIQLLRDRKLIAQPTLGMLLLICLGLFFYVDLNIGGVNWSHVCQAIQEGQQNLFSVLQKATIYTLARAILMFSFALCAWQLCRPTVLDAAKKTKFVFAILIICVFGDCVLFQTELYSHFHRESKQFEFPVTKLNWPITRDSQMVENPPEYHAASAGNSNTKLFCDIARWAPIPTNQVLKYKAWTSAPWFEAEYQISISSVLQWDPPTPKFRVDWLASNVVAMEQILGKISTQELALVSGSKGLKFRLLEDSSAIYVKTDEEAFKLLGSRAGWDRQVILTDPTGVNTTHASQTSVSDSSLILGDFSANSFTLSVSNGLAQPAWLIYADAYSPGWHATVNHKPVPVLKAYGAFKAVRVQPGVNQVHYFYHDGIHWLCLNAFAVMAGAAIAVALLCLLWLIIKEIFMW